MNQTINKYPSTKWLCHRKSKQYLRSCFKKRKLWKVNFLMKFNKINIYFLDIVCLYHCFRSREKIHLHSSSSAINVFLIFCSGGLTLRIDGKYFNNANTYVLRLTTIDTGENIDSVRNLLFSKFPFSEMFINKTYWFFSSVFRFCYFLKIFVVAFLFF